MQYTLPVDIISFPLFYFDLQFSMYIAEPFFFFNRPVNYDDEMMKAFVLLVSLSFI